MKPIEERLSDALDRLSDGAALDSHVDEDLRPFVRLAGYLSESMVRIPAPEPWRRELRDWLTHPRRRPWWRRLMDPLQRRVPPRARRPAVGAAIGFGALAAVAVGVILTRQRRVASASL
jgi:hypothetical protein